MAVLCPIYDPLCGNWYVIDKDGKKKYFFSVLFYYYSLGVSPPVGAKITQSDIDDFENDLYAENENKDLESGDLGFLPTYPEQISSLPSTSLIGNSTSTDTPAWLIDLCKSFLQYTSHTFPNAFAKLTDLYYASQSSATLPLPTSAAISAVAGSEEMDMLDDEDEFDDLLSSIKSSTNSEMSHDNAI